MKFYVQLNKYSLEWMNEWVRKSFSFIHWNLITCWVVLLTIICWQIDIEMRLNKNSYAISRNSIFMHLNGFSSVILIFRCFQYFLVYVETRHWESHLMDFIFDCFFEEIIETIERSGLKSRQSRQNVIDQLDSIITGCSAGDYLTSFCVYKQKKKNY